MTAPLAVRLRRQGEQCGLSGSPLYEVLLTGAADDLEAGGPTAQVMAGQQDQPSGSVPALRLTGALHRLVLERRAPGLAVHFPSVGGTAGTADAWTAARTVLAAQTEDVRSLLANPVQTNEPARSAVLWGGLTVLAARTGLPVRLLEIGASGGLNLHPDRYAYVVGDQVLGDVASPVRIDQPWPVGGSPRHAPVRIVERAGCDPRPVDVTTTEGRLTLTSFVWADQVHRLERLRGAFTVAAEHHVPIEPVSASQFLDGRLSRPRRGVLTVVWHSVVWQYLQPAEQTRTEHLLTQALGAATPDAPVAHLSMEGVQVGHEDYRFRLWLALGDGGRVRRETLADCEGHGPPVTWTL